jgi:sugar lactone lactonase YvrE
MRNIALAILAATMLATFATALTSTNLNDGVVGYEQGYFVGTFYKEADPRQPDFGCVYKVYRVTDDAVKIEPFESGELAVR